MAESTLEAALQQFEATEANLAKLQDLWSKISALISSGPAFGAPEGYDEHCRAFRRILAVMPSIGGLRIEDHLMDFDTVGQLRLDCLEVAEVGCTVSTEKEIEGQGIALDDFRFLLAAKRRELIQARMLELIDEVDDLLRTIIKISGDGGDEPGGMQWNALEELIAEIGMLLGASGRSRKWRWGDLQRHLRFGSTGDLDDILKMDWPNVKSGILEELYGEHDPLPVSTRDLAELVASRPNGPVSTKLHWSNLSDEDFERLLFALISTTDGYENPKWLHAQTPLIEAATFRSNGSQTTVSAEFGGNG